MSIANCKVCGSDEVAFGARFNPAQGHEAVYLNFCRPCALNWQSLPPKPPTKWKGQYGGTFAHHSLSVFEPFTGQELEALNGDIEGN